MLETEFIRSLQNNYEIIHLHEKPDDKRYQYCIITRGGIKGLLPCSLRYVNGAAYLYYDITSKQNVVQMCSKQLINRDWVKDFFWGYAQMKQELARFLLDENNIMLYPEHIFQDVGNRNFLFLYLPYSEEENGASKLLEFILDHMDYEDEKLVECVYSMYEQYERLGDIYLQTKIFEDVNNLEALPKEEAQELSEELFQENTENYQVANAETLEVAEEKLGFWNIFGRKKKAKQHKEVYQSQMKDYIEGVAVAEGAAYEEEEYERTVYMEAPADNAQIHKLYTPDGRVAAILETDSFLIGKQKEEVNFVLDDPSVSRIHARIYKEGELVFLEDLNSRNGTRKNGIKLQPYEKRRLEEDDEVKFGSLLFVYR